VSSQRLRSRRKVEHLRLVLNHDPPPGRNSLDDVELIHNCLPETDAAEIDLSSEFCGLRIDSPIFINAITGGHSRLTRVNRALARAAAENRIPIAVGSEVAALRDPSVRCTYEVVREENPYGIVIANVGAGTGVRDALAAVEMVQAQALQVHLNAAQELFMPEGDRSFRGWLASIADIADACPVPVIAKETGSGVSAEAALRIGRTGARAIDVGGSGGTSFVHIERHRGSVRYGAPLDSWGIPTAASLVECVRTVGDSMDVLASGGIRNGLDVAKCLALGAKACGLAGSIVRVLLSKGQRALNELIRDIVEELRVVMALVGASTVGELAQKPVLILGHTAEWLERRGFAVNRGHVKSD